MMLYGDGFAAFCSFEQDGSMADNFEMEACEMLLSVVDAQSRSFLEPN
jgi:hypothetical protein